VAIDGEDVPTPGALRHDPRVVGQLPDVDSTLGGTARTSPGTGMSLAGEIDDFALGSPHRAAEPNGPARPPSSTIATVHDHLSTREGTSTMTTRVAHPTDLLTLAADQPELGASDWRMITQQQVDLFADATDDHQWIHVDPGRAETGPFGTTIAHGYLTVSLASAFIAEILQVGGVRMAVNYGLNKVRFPAPVPVGARLRGHLRLTAAQTRGDMVEVVLTLTVEIDGSARPACVAEVVVLYRT